MANFARVRYPEVYPGVDEVYYGRGSQFEYDFVVAPEADPRGIVMAWDGADSIAVDETGALVVKVGEVELRQHAPVLYQETEAGRTEVAGRYMARGGRLVGVAVGSYDTTKPLVIDSVLAYSTFLGGSGQDTPETIAVGYASGAAYAYVVGRTLSSNFPTWRAYDATDNGGGDAFVTNLSPAGTSIIYSTFLGGTDIDIGNAIAVDSSGAAYVTGITNSIAFPTTANAFDQTYNGEYADVFVAKLQ